MAVTNVNTPRFPDLILPHQISSPVYSIPKVSMLDTSIEDYTSSYVNNKVNLINPEIMAEKLNHFNNNVSGSPVYSKSPTPLGSILQTPPDYTPSRYMNPGRVTPVHNPPEISKSIYDFVHLQHKTIEEKVDDAKKRADYRVKYGILRESYPDMNIPDPKDDESIEEIEAAYKQYVKRIHVESSVEQNKMYLLILWLIIDVAGTRLFRLPFNGKFIKSQFKYMKKYQMLLIELGERSYNENSNETGSVEMRLLMMAIFHGVIFVLIQLLSSKLGATGAGTEQMIDGIRDSIDNLLTQDKGADVLRRAEQATADMPIPEAVPDNPAPPMGGIGELLGNFMPMIMNFMGGNSAEEAATPPPQKKKPTTFAARRHKTD